MKMNKKFLSVASEVIAILAIVLVVFLWFCVGYMFGFGRGYNKRQEELSRPQNNITTIIEETNGVKTLKSALNEKGMTTQVLYNE